MCSDRFAVKEGVQLFRISAVHDDHIHAGFSGNFCGIDLGRHAAAAQCRTGTACHLFNAGIDFPDFPNDLCIGIGAGVGGVQSVDVGQMEAARSLGIPYWKAMQKVVLPQAIRTMIPSIINQFIITLKDTSILSVIGFPELVNAAQNVIAINFKSFQVWFLVGLMYLIVITILSKIAKALERRMNRGRK
mgnify:CR=1 FL=1